MPDPDPLPADIAAAVAAVEPPDRRRGAQVLIELMQRVTAEPPVLWGSIIGFGSYHYRYQSGREGDAMLAGFAPRKAEFSIYLHGTYLPEQAAARQLLLERLGPHRIGKACLYVKRLSDIDLDILEQLVALSVEGLRSHYTDTWAQ